MQTNLQPQLLTRLQLDLRGRRFSVDRETIMNLPESILLCLFPNGLVLSRQSAALSDGGDNDDYEELYGVDVRVYSLFLRLCVRPHAHQPSPHPSSLIQSASPTYSSSSGTRPTHFTGRPIHRDSLRRSNISSKAGRQRPTLVHRPPRTPSCRSRPSSSSARNWSISRYRPKMARQLPMAAVSRMRRYWTSSANVAITCSTSGISSPPSSGMSTRRTTLRNSTSSTCCV